MLRLAFARPWRQTEGLLRSVTTLLGLSLDVPDHTTLSRRSAALSLVTALAVPTGPVTVVIDSTGLKVFGAGEWQMAKHGGRDWRIWRKLHLAIDPDTGEVFASALTTTEEGDASLVRPLLDQIAAPIAAVLADGAYDGDPVYRAVADRAPAATVIIPPRATAVVGEVSAAGTPTPRDRHIATGMAEGRRLRPALARQDRDAALQDHHRPNAPRPDSAGTKGRGQGRLQGAQPHDRSRHARFSKARLKPPGRATAGPGPQVVHQRLRRGLMPPASKNLHRTDHPKRLT